jgi:hypothetical protein
MEFDVTILWFVSLLMIAVFFEVSSARKAKREEDKFA